MDVRFIFYQYLFEDSFSFRQLLVATWDVLRIHYGASVFFVHSEFYKGNHFTFSFLYFFFLLVKTVKYVAYESQYDGLLL